MVEYVNQNQKQVYRQVCFHILGISPGVLVQTHQKKKSKSEKIKQAEGGFDGLQPLSEWESLAEFMFVVGGVGHNL